MHINGKNTEYRDDLVKMFPGRRISLMKQIKEKGEGEGERQTGRKEGKEEDRKIRGEDQEKKQFMNKKLEAFEISIKGAKC